MIDMKKILIVLGLLLVMMCSCSPQKWFLVNTNGIMTYNRNTGQFELIWEWQEKQNPVQRDSVSILKQE